MCVAGVWGRGRGGRCSAGQVPTGQTVSGRRRGGVTYGFTASLPDLLAVRAGILSCLYPAMDQCVEYVYILSANFTQKRRGVGGRHKPFPPDDQAHPSKARATGGFCRDRVRQSDGGTLLLHWATQLSRPPLTHSPRDPLAEARCGPSSRETKCYRSQTATNLSPG